MNRRLLSSLTISGCLALFSGQRAAACSSGSATITNLFSSSDTFQVAGLSSAGDLTGYFYGSLPAHAFLYHDGAVTDLGTLGGTISEGFALNSSGNVAGVSYLGGNAQLNAFLYSGGTLVNLGALGGTYSSASLINDAGQVAGDVQLPNASDTTAFLYSNGTMVSLGTLGGTYSSPFALNALGQLTGESYTTNGDTHAFLGSSAGLQDLGTLGGTYSSGFDLNNDGVVVGESAVSTGDTHAFVFAAGSMVDLGTFGGTYSSALHINTNGLVIGIATTAADAETHAFIYNGGALTDLGTLGGTLVVPYAINGAGQVVGTAALAGGTRHAFIWQKNQITDLNTLLPANSGWELAQAQFINDAGRIVGSGLLNGVSQWFILDLPNGNQPPIAVAGPDQTVDCQAQVTLDGSHSSDPDNDPLTYEWSTAGNVIGTSATLTVSLPMGTNVVTLKVTDSCNASSETNVTVIVADTTPPTGTCPNSLTVSADANCQATVPDFTSQVAAHDNCTPAQSLVITQNPVAGTAVGLGQHPVTITVTDASGNSSTCAVLLTVADTTPPTILSGPSSIKISAGANCQGTVPNVLSAVLATDNCTPANQLVLTQAPAAGTVLPKGFYTIVVTATDASANSSTLSVPFEIDDTTAPTILSAPSSITLSSDAHCQAAVPDLTSSVFALDNCTPSNQLVFAQNPAPGTMLTDGAYTITVTVTDAAGNSAITTVPLSIVDTTAPVFQALSVSPSVLSPPNHQLIPVTVSATVTDNCDPAPCTRIVSITCNETTAPGDIQITGNLTASLAATKSSSGNTRVYTIHVQSTDASGNSSTGSVTVSVPKSNGGSTVGNNKLTL